MEYNVKLEYRLPATPENGDKLVTGLESFSPAAGPADNGSGNIDVWITLQAASPRQAIDTGIALGAQATDAELVALEVLPTADFDRRQGLTPMPELVGPVDAAGILGISRQAVLVKFEKGELKGQRVGERAVVFARHDVEAIAARRGAKADLGVTYSAALPVN